MSFTHRRVCEGFIVCDDETPTRGNVSCAHLEPETLKCRFFQGNPKCDDLVWVVPVKERHHEDR